MQGRGVQQKEGPLTAQVEGPPQASAGPPDSGSPPTSQAASANAAAVAVLAGGSKGRRSDETSSGGLLAQQIDGELKQHTRRGSRYSTKGFKRNDDVMTALAVPRGYLDYWNERIDEVVADMEENEEFENAYKKQEQRLFPFRTSSTEWTINGALGTLVFVMAWGPIAMSIGFVLGGLIGFALSLANDMCRLKRRQSAAKQQRRRIDQLMRWANYHFETSQSQLQLIFKVIMEYQVLARLGGSSKTARSQLKLLFQFLSREDVGHCLWLYLDYFLLNFKKMARNEISMCFLVCQVCTQCVDSLRKTPPAVVARMNDLMADETVQAIFKSAKASSLWRKKPEAEREENAILCADVGKEVQRHVMKGGDLVQALRMDKPPSRALVLSDTSQESEEEEEGSDEEMSREEREGSAFESLAPEISAVDLRPNTTFNVALPTPLSDSAPNRRSSSIRPSGQVQSSKSIKSGQIDFIPSAEGPQQQQQQQQMLQQGPARLFKSYEDLVNFDTKLKHQTPIGAYEFQFLEEKQSHDPSDPMWELTVDQQHIKVYKYNSPDSPVVLVKAYAKLDGIPLNVLCHHIRHIPTRLKWDTTFGDYRVVEQDVDGCEMIYCLMKAPFPVSNRDFLQWRRTEEDAEANVTRMLLRSADHPSMPEKSGVVRAETLISGYIMEAQKTDSSSSTLFILAQTDVKGLIPKWVVNTTAARAPVGWVDSLRKACKAYMKLHGDFVPPYNPVA
ncbi:hypothetical protein Efla_005110 [Eimeria flavescens]